MSGLSPVSELERHAAWSLDRIKDHSWKIGSGITPSGGAASYLDAGIPLLRSQNIHFDGLRLDDVAFIGDGVHADMAGTRLREGDVLLNITGASIGRCTFVPLGFGEGNVNQHVCIIRPSARLDHRYLTYCLAAPWGQDQILSGFTGASRQGLGQRELGEIQVPLPPRTEQERIAAYLDASCAAIDAAVTAKRRQIETVDSIRTSVITQTVTQGLDGDLPRRESRVAWLGRIPRHWRSGHLKRFATKIQTGVTPPTDTPEYYEDGTIPWFAPGSYDGDIDLRNPRKLISEVALRDGALRMFPSGTVFLIGIGATIGKVGLISEAASCNQQIIGIVSNHAMLARYLTYQLKIYEAVIPGIAIGTTLPIFDQVKTGYLPVLVPPREEQQVICDYLDGKLVEMKQTVASIQGQIDVLVSYRKSLVHECVTGQRRISMEDLNRVKAHG